MTLTLCALLGQDMTTMRLSAFDAIASTLKTLGGTSITFEFRHF
jgi:hypothetical protein